MFHFTVKHKFGKLNKGSDVVSRRYLLLVQLSACVLGFEHLKSVYNVETNFRELFKECQRHPKGEFIVQEVYLFKGKWLCL